MPLPRPSESSSRWHDHNSTPSMGRQRPKSARRKRLESPISLRPLNCAAQSTLVSFLTAGMAEAVRPGPFPAEFGAAAPTVSCQKGRWHRPGQVGEPGRLAPSSNFKVASPEGAQAPEPAQWQPGRPAECPHHGMPCAGDSDPGVCPARPMYINRHLRRCSSLHAAC